MGVKSLFFVFLFLSGLGKEARASFLPYGIKQLTFSYEDTFKGKKQRFNYVIHEAELAKSKFYGVMFYFGDEDLSARPDDTREVKVLPEETVWSVAEFVLQFTDPDLSFTEKSFAKACGEFGKAFKLSAHNYRVGVDPPFFGRKVALSCQGASRDFMKIRQLIETTYWAGEEHLLGLQNRFYKMRAVEEAFRSLESRQARANSEKTVFAVDPAKKYAGRLLYAITHAKNPPPEIELQRLEQIAARSKKREAEIAAQVIESSTPYKVYLRPRRELEGLPHSQFSGYIDPLYGDGTLTPISFSHFFKADVDQPYKAKINYDFEGTHFGVDSEKSDRLKIKLAGKDRFIVHIKEDHVMILNFSADVLLPNKGNGTIRSFTGNLFEVRKSKGKKSYELLGRVALFDSSVYKNQAPDKKTFSKLFANWSTANY